MPFIASTYKSPIHLGAHFETIFPSYFLKEDDVEYQRERIDLPDGDFLYLDWARCDKPTDELMVICHGLCGNTHRHYCLSMVHAFRKAGIDCLAWNYRGTGKVENRTLRFTCNNSTDDLHQVVMHAIRCGYKKIYLGGFSMGANLIILYLGRELKVIPDEVMGGVGFCAPIDGPASIQTSHKALFGIYEKHFLEKLKEKVQEVARNFPEFDATEALNARNFTEFDESFTARTMGFRGAQDYYVTASAVRYLGQIDRPTLLVNPKNDPLLGGDSHPVNEARESKFFYLETPEDGGHCGFLTPKGQEWWPAARARQFILETVRNSAHRGTPQAQEKPVQPKEG